MSEDLPEPIPLQAGSIPINTFVDGTDPGDLITWDGTEWVSAPGGGGGAPSIAGTTNQINTSGSTISLSSEIITPKWQTPSLKVNQLTSVISTTALSMPIVNIGCFISIGSINYNTGTASQAGNTITGIGTTFTSSMLGLPFIFTNNTNISYIVSVNSTTSLTVSYSQNVSAQSYAIYNLIYNANNVNTTNGTLDSKVGVGTIAPANKFSVMPLNTTLTFPGTVSQAANVVTGVGTNFTSALLNMHIVYLNGTYGGIITSISSTTELTVNTSQTVASTRYTLHYPGFHVNSNGQILISGKVFTTETISSTNTLSVSLDTIFDSLSTFSCALGDGIDNQYKIVRLKSRINSPVTINCTIGTFDLDANNDMRKLRYDASVGYWEIEGGNSILVPCPTSFYPSRQFGVAIESDQPYSINAQSGKAAISADGSVLVLGAANDDFGGTFILNRSGSAWVQQGNTLVGTGYTGDFPYQGAAVAISADGKTIAVGAPGDNSEVGAVWIFINNNGVWTQQGDKLVGTGFAGLFNPYQGGSVSLSVDGNTLAIGGPQADERVGATWVFTRSGTTWTQQAKLVGTGYSGTTINQGQSVSLSSNGNILAVGSLYFSPNIGGAWIFTRSGTTWTQQGTVLIGTGGIGDTAQGSSVSLNADGTILASGGFFDNNSTGAVWLFTNNNGNWTQFGNKLLSSNSSFGDGQGSVVTLNPNGDSLAVNAGFDATSRVIIYTRLSGIWKEKTVLTATSNTNYNIGSSLAFSSNGNLLAVGSILTNESSETKATAWIFT